MPKPPESLILSRMPTTIGDVLLISDAEGAVRALDFAGYEPRMMQLLKRHWGEVELAEGSPPPAAQAALKAYFAGDLSALERITVRTNGTAFQEKVWAATLPRNGNDMPGGGLSPHPWKAPSCCEV